jgi:Domain of unknown function (DUF4202)
MTDLIAQAYAAIDRENADDPKTIEVDGAVRPAALVYGERMTAMLETFKPDASGALKIACRAQHLRRFDLPRDSYPMDKQGYFAWRNAQKAAHAEKAGAILLNLGADQDLIDRVGSLIRKERLKRDPEAQALEDVACLVFLAFEFEAFALSHDDQKLVEIVAKTWPKMSDDGHQRALALAPALAPRLRSIVAKALGG